MQLLNQNQFPIVQYYNDLLIPPFHISPFIFEIVAHCSKVLIHSLIIFMYGQKFNPYGQFPSKNNQLYQEQYEEEDSEPLVEEVDQSYEPTEKEVRQYAIETLGMSLPEDEGLLYLAREGLKAPLPPNWVPYQGRDGEVYYKHRITQEKTYDHPTDIEYHKKYEQQKEKMARKNLKSMNMKASNPLAGPSNSNFLNNNASNLFGSSKLSNSNMIGGSSLLVGGEVMPVVKLDPKIQQEYEDDLRRLQERLKKEWREYDEEEREKHENRMKKNKQQYEIDMDRLLKGKGSQIKIEDKLREEKQKSKRNLEAQLENKVIEQIKQCERELEHKNKQFVTIYEEDNNLKINKFQQEKDHQFEDRERRYNDSVDKLNKLKERKKKDREDVLAALKTDLQNGNNKQIEQATIVALQQELQSIKETYLVKIKQKQSQLQRQYNQTKRVLGFDQGSYLSQLTAKKTRIKFISQQKINSFRNKQIQSLNLKSQIDVENAIRSLKDSLESDFSLKLTEERQRQQARIAKQKQKLDKQYKQKCESQIQNIYEQLKMKVKTYEKDMNKKLTTMQDKFITDIFDKGKNQSQDITLRMEIKEKEMSLESKNVTIASIKRQMQLQKITYDLLKLQTQLQQCSDTVSIDDKLTKIAKNYDIDYRSSEYLKYESQYKQMKIKYKKDKQFLASVMNSLQNNKSSGVGGSILLKQYNQDVRIMRDNQEHLRYFQSLLKRAEINDRQALTQLNTKTVQYKQIQLKREIGRGGQGSAPIIIQQLNQDNSNRSKYSTGHRDIETAVKQHSRFLTSMRGELNRKLYQIRSGSFY